MHRHMSMIFPRACVAACIPALTCGTTRVQLLGGMTCTAARVRCVRFGPGRRTYLAGVPTRDVNETWAAFIRARMKTHGMAGPSDLARASGVDQSVISRWLNEGRTPTVDALRRLVAPLKTSLRDLLIAAGHATEEDLPVGGATDSRPAVETEGSSVGGGEQGADELVFRLRVPPNATPRQRETARRAAEASARAVLEELDREES